MQENAVASDSASQLRVHGKKEGASFQIIVLGPSGGPREDNITGLLVRAPQSEWRKGSLIAVDGGAHLAAIVHLLKLQMPMTSAVLAEPGYAQVLDTGPFAGVKFPHISAKANSLHIFRELLHSVLITHPHLDHVSGIAINTPALEYGREAKAIVALPSTIDAIKGHIFNDAIWPNLSDEGHGVGFITYRRLIEGGNPRLGLGEARGYINVCDGLATKCWSVSHGKCDRHSQSISHNRGESFGRGGNDYNFPSRRMSRISDHGYFNAIAEQQAHSSGAYPPAAPGAPPPPSVTPGAHLGNQGHVPLDSGHLFEPVSSSAFFIRNDATGQEILIFGDIEPDSVSLYPRNHIVWEDAASKIAHGTLRAIFIECSYDDDVRDADLYGHLCPRHLIAELTFLARCILKQRSSQVSNGNGKVEDVQAIPSTPDMNMSQPPTAADLNRKRKRKVTGDLVTTPELEPTRFGTPPSPQTFHSYVGTRSVSQTRRKLSHGRIDVGHDLTASLSIPSKGRSVSVQHSSKSLVATDSNISQSQPAQTPDQSQSSSPTEPLNNVLKGLTVHIIHVKDTMVDGPPPGHIILAQLQRLSAEAGLGVEFDVTEYGESIWV